MTQKITFSYGNKALVTEVVSPCKENEIMARLEQQMNAGRSGRRSAPNDSGFEP